MIFECVGVPGVIEDIVDGAPLFSLDLRFVIGYTPLEFRDTLHMLAEGKVDPRPLITGQVGLGGVDAAFTALADPETHAKVLIDPRSTATEPSPPGR